MNNLKLFTTVAAFFSLVLFGCDKEMDGPVSPPGLAEVEPSPCTSPPLRQWLFQQFEELGLEATFVVANEKLKMSELAISYAAIFDNSSVNQTFGFKGEYTNQVNNSFKALKRFWDIPSDNIIMVAGHGSVLQDRSKVVETYKSRFGYSDAKANHYADTIATLLETYPQYLNGNHPAFTFNQVARPDTTYAGVGRIPNKIVIGDGILQGFAALGYGDIASEAILAHEFGHQIQYELGILDTRSKLTPKTSRRFELMADAYAAYFLSHGQGAAMQGDEVRQFLAVFSNTGDCEFTVYTHHGTPSQRKAAAEWGYELATDAQKQGQVLPSKEFARLFDAALDNIVKN